MADPGSTSAFPVFTYQSDYLPLTARRNRVVQSCSECRRRKIKCDRRFPCGPCILRGEDTTCKEYTKEGAEPPPPPAFPSIDDFDKLVTRVRFLEDRINVIATGSSNPGLIALLDRKDRNKNDWRGSKARLTLTSDVRGSGSGSEDNGDMDGDEEDRSMSPAYGDGVGGGLQPEQGLGMGMGLGVGLSARAEGKRRMTEAYSKAPSLNENHAALALESIALNRPQDIHREEMKSVFSGVGGQYRTPENMNDPSEASPFVADTIVRVNVPGLHSYPTVQVAAFLMDHFLSNVEWLIRCFHVPTFIARWTAFNSQPPSSPMTIDDAAFFALACSCLCVSLHLMNDDTLLQMGYSERMREMAIAEWNQLMLDTMHVADWGGNHRIEWIQAYLVIGLYWNSINAIERHLTWLGLAVKVAHGLGISRLGPELEPGSTEAETAARFGRRWVKAADREAARRAWYSLIDLDYSMSPERQFTYIIPEKLNASVEPANCNDNDLMGHGPVLSMPMTQHTDMTLYLNRLHLSYPLRTFVNKVVEHGRLRYSFVQEAHADLLERTVNLSPFYRIGCDVATYATDASQVQKLQAEQRVLNCHGHLRFLRLHRIYLPQSFNHMKYAFSREVVVRSGRFILDNPNIRGTHLHIPGRYWPINYGILTATIAMFVCYCHAPEYETKDLLYMIQRGIDALRQESGSDALKASAGSLQTILDKEIANRLARHTTGRGSGRKRIAEDQGDSGRAGTKPSPSGQSSESNKHRTPAAAGGVLPWATNLSIPAPSAGASSGNSTGTLDPALVGMLSFPGVGDASTQLPSFWDPTTMSVMQPDFLTNWLPTEQDGLVPMAGTQDENLLDFLKFSFPDLQAEDGWWPPLDAPDAQ